MKKDNDEEEEEDKISNKEPRESIKSEKRLIFNEMNNNQESRRESNLKEENFMTKKGFKT